MAHDSTMPSVAETRCVKFPSPRRERLCATMAEMQPHGEDVFADPTLVRPDPTAPDLVHVVRALATLCGVPGLDDFAATRGMVDTIGVADHYVFILLDGLGMNLIRKLPEDSFLKRHLRMQLHTICPSTTACALTSVATGVWPAQHGITGWFVYLPDRKLSVTTLPFSDRVTGQPLVQRGINVEDVIAAEALHPKMSYSSLTLLPSSITNTPYALFSRGRTPALGYHSMGDAIDRVVAAVSHAKGCSYTHLYIPDVDTACHHHGVDDPSVLELVQRIDGELSRLAEALAGSARLVITADH